MAPGESSDDDDMPGLLDQTSDGESDDGGKKPKSKSKSKSQSKSKSKTKTPGSPVKVEESPEAKAQRLLETEATGALEGILADAARTEDTEVVKKGIAAAKDLECALPAHRALPAHLALPTHLPPHISNSPHAATTRHSLLRRAKVALSLAQRNGKTPQDALNLLLRQLQETETALESRLPVVIQAEKEKKKLLAEQKEQDRKEKEIARKKAPARRTPPILASVATSLPPPPSSTPGAAPAARLQAAAEAKKKKAKEKLDEEERLRSEQVELDVRTPRRIARRRPPQCTCGSHEAREPCACARPAPAAASPPAGLGQASLGRPEASEAAHRAQRH
jgi:hypothetical protein